MMDSWRLRIREADEAFRAGRLEEASRRVRRFGLESYRPGQILALKLGKAFRQRGMKAAQGGEIADAWHDLNEARLLAPDDVSVLRDRSSLVDLTLDLIRQAISKGNSEHALVLLMQFDRFSLSDQRTEPLRQAVGRIRASEELANEGRFGEAGRSIEVAMELVPEVDRLREIRDQRQRQRRQCRDLTEQLRKAMTRCDWPRGVALADQLLEIAPGYQIAKDARQICSWAQINKVKQNPLEMGPTSREFGGGAGAMATMLAPRESRVSAESEAITKMDTGIPRRFLMWVDGVGGYMVCTNDHILIGQAVPDGGVDIPIQGDISRRHVRIERTGGDYVIEPLSHVSLDGVEISGRSVLGNEHIIEIGEGVKLRFWRPHALSSSARIDFESRHRTHPWADGVLLMADSFVLGPGSRNHVVCHDWNDDLVIYRREDELHCRGPERMEVDGESAGDEPRLRVDSHVTGEDFALSLEPL